ncbi:MAG: SDR family NAD(P)-dependent oxidoreductase [Bacteroidota bacterium]
MENKKAIIVGASSGIGKGLAEQLVQDGYVVGITGRREEKLLSIQEKYPEKVVISAFDVTEHTHSINCLQKLIQEMGGVDLFVYCSGQGVKNEDLSFLLDYKVIRVNITGFTNVMTFMFKYMQNQGHGHVVNISSVAGLRGNHMHAAYHASKSYQCIYMEGLRKKSYKRHLNVKVTDIRPGFVKTEFIADRPSYLVASLEKAVKQIYAAIRKQRKVVYITKRYMIVAFLMKTFPCFLYDRCP